MKDERFEELLRAQPLRQVPSAWRAGILERANAAADIAAPMTRGQDLPWWRAWLWPHPVAWGGLAAAWLLSLGLGWSTPAPGDGRSSPAARAVSVSELQAALVLWHRAAIEMTEPDAPKVAEPPSPTPALPPHSRRLTPLSVRLT